MTTINQFNHVLLKPDFNSAIDNRYIVTIPTGQNPIHYVLSRCNGSIFLTVKGNKVYVIIPGGVTFNTAGITVEHITTY